jgi:hypothetical protein
MQPQAGAMNMWAGLWAQIFDYFLLTIEKTGEREETRTPDLHRVNLAFFGLTTTYKPRVDCQSTRKSYKTSLFVGWRCRNYKHTARAASLLAAPALLNMTLPSESNP